MDEELEKNYRERIDSESYRGPYTEEEKKLQNEREKIYQEYKMKRQAERVKKTK
ncbi:hypothetical protein [Enterococcus columbae]|uniref:Uncharacterized protein n=1 Tax=Enterococcus columbae DSM 7374 = ATCC 51263 TaxID=1121865 RepID=S1NF02_9ENTE|nr:hypothetical protein [Enterococcus columbae]EOT44955.1 hypothetical protein OMW_00142 [Enterococcus columbae DSM 7374 = ATCC 51263]EOW84248.1 hypothetical protein I568_00736 [Enterococcus columbae DSM 7374 = ATCC 51263]